MIFLGDLIYHGDSPNRKAALSEICAICALFISRNKMFPWEQSHTTYFLKITLRSLPGFYEYTSIYSIVNVSLNRLYTGLLYDLALVLHNTCSVYKVL